MTVNEVIAELTAYAEDGYGDKKVCWMNLNTGKLDEVEDVSPISDGSGIEVS
jgi:hypothetical protein